MTYWLIEHEDGSVEQIADAPGTKGNPEGVRSAEIPRDMCLATERWDWDAQQIVTKFTAAEARDIMWERAKAYRDVDRYFATLAVADVVPGEVVMVECDAKSRVKVADLAQAATWAMLEETAPGFTGTPFLITFTDGANEPFTINAEQTIAIKAAVTRNDALCHAASQGVRAALTAALAGGASAEDIFAIDITAGYPAADPET